MRSVAGLLLVRIGVLKVIRFAVILAGLVLLGCARAAAQTELCGAEPRNIVALHQPAADTHALFADTAYGYVLRGGARRTVSGHLNIYTGTDNGYRVGFTNVPLTRTEHQVYRKDNAPYLKYIDYESAPLYFGLPKNETVEDVWVDDSAFEGHPSSPCQISPFDLESHDTTLFGLRDDAGVPAAQIRAAAPAVLPTAAPIAMPEVGACGKRYTPPVVEHYVRAEYPEALRFSYNGPVNVISKVLIDQRGSVVDTWLFGSSGLVPFDKEGLRVAGQATYRPAQFLCDAVPAVYIFVQAFDL